MFQLMDLPYAKDALAPLMSADTLNVHHGKHHLAYVNKTNSILKERGETPVSLEEVVKAAHAKQDKALFNQSAQVWNHGFFWHSLTPNKPALGGALAAAIDAAFGSRDKFREDFIAKGVGQFGSGWVWLVSDSAGKVSLTTTSNAETPLTDASVTPILTCDVWEHAYYIDVKNERPRFLEGFFDTLANWTFAAEQYEAAKANRGPWRYPT